MQNNIRFYTRATILAAIGAILMLFGLPLPLFPEFLKLDASEIPVLLGAFTFGPLAGVLIELLKNILHLFTTKTAGIGELANFIISSAFVSIAGYIFRNNSTRQGAVLGLIIGTIVMSFTAALANYLIFIPLYEMLLNFPIEIMVSIGHKFNSSITDLRTLIIFSILPFNIIKGIILSFIMLSIYPKIAPLITASQEKS